MTTVAVAPSIPHREVGTAPAVRSGPEVDARPRVAGKFLFAGDEKLYVRGVTYGPFCPTADGCEYHDPSRAARDFATMAAHGVNTVRVYTVPPRWLLDLAYRYGLRVMVGLPWEQHVAFLDDPACVARIERAVREGVRACADHPAVLAYAIGNEIPSTIVRWYGRRRIERFLRRLYGIAKAEDPAALVTYVNFPTTEFLQLPFLDFVCFNVYLETSEKLEPYLARLQSLAHNKPLVLAEIGLDSDRNGLEGQAGALAWQLRSCFASGAAGLFVFSWTDEWYRGGNEILDWSFGLVDRLSRPKPALAAVATVFESAPFPDDLVWPTVSVVVCSHNGAATIRQCCGGLRRLLYPNFEVVIINDGSTDNTPAIVEEFPEFRLVTVPNGGLSRARNLGMELARGEIIVYLDDDAWPDPHWLHYLAWAFMNGDDAAVGGPNIPPAEDGPIAECVAHAPGGPCPVLLTDRSAEHVPGCNMAFRRDRLAAVGGFDPQFRIAGDDVDVCWKLLERDWTIGYHAGAMVWHHRRRSLRTYLRQQTNYGRAEALLERKWPHKYNSLGHVSWGGRVYGSAAIAGLLRAGRVYHGVWGSAAFQWLDHAPVGFWRSLPHMPEWYLVCAALLIASALGVVWPPMLLALPFLAITVGIPAYVSYGSAASITAIRPGASLRERFKLRSITALLHLTQPLMRLRGRLLSGLTPWRGWRYRRWARPRTRQHILWSETWRSAESRLGELETSLRHIGPFPARGGPADRWDLEARGGMFGSVRVLMAIEEHGDGRQLIRLTTWPCAATVPTTFALVTIAGCMAAGAMDWLGFAIVLGALSLLVSLRATRDCSIASAACLDALDHVSRPAPTGKVRLWDETREPMT